MSLASANGAVNAPRAFIGRLTPIQPAAQRARLAGPPIHPPAERLRGYLLSRNYSQVYRDSIVAAVADSDDPADTLIDLVASGELDAEDIVAARQAYRAN